MRDARGFSLLEVLIALFLLAIGVLAAAPMFVYASKGNATGADFGSVGALAVERMELLRGTEYASLTPGGSLTANVNGYFDASNPGFAVRWTIANVGSPSATRSITVRARALRELEGPQRQVTLSTLRGN